MGLEATLALTGGSGGVSGDRRTRMGHIYPLPGSMAPQGDLCPKLARLTEANGKNSPKQAGSSQPWLSAAVLGGSWGLDGRTWVTPTHCRNAWRPRVLYAPSTPASPMHIQWAPSRPCRNSEMRGPRENINS